MMDRLTHNSDCDLYIIRLDKAPGIEWLSMSLTAYELRRVFMLLVSHFCDTSPEITHQFKGLVTIDNGDGIDRIIEETGAPKSSQWRAKKAVESGTYKGARAWLNIGNYGICARDDALTEDPAEDDELIKDCRPTTTLDAWGI